MKFHLLEKDQWQHSKSTDVQQNDGSDKKMKNLDGK